MMNIEYLVKNKIHIAALALLALVVLYMVFGRGYDSRVTGLIEKNVAAKGGEAAWEKVTSLRLSGRMSLGQGVVVPYSIEQKRPLRMCTEYEFNKRRVVQCVDGKNGWQFVPYLGRNRPEKLSKEDVLGIADTASIDGMLLNAYERGFDIAWQGQEDINGLPADKLEIKMPGGTVRWIYIDEISGLEAKLEFKRMLGKNEQTVETSYSDWKEAGGLWFPGKTVTRIKGASESNFVTIDKIEINPMIEDKRFGMPVYASADK